MAGRPAGVYVRWAGDEFEEAFFSALADQVSGAAMIFRRALSTVLATTGKSPPAQKNAPFVAVPYNRTGLLSGSWHATSARREGTKFVARVGTPVRYALWLITKGRNQVPGGRDYLSGKLAWKMEAVQAVEKHLSVRRIITVATRKFKKGGIGRRVT